jgi:hypothetical protein
MTAPSPPRRIEIPEELARQLDARRHGSAFPSLDAYVAFVLARLAEEPATAAFSEEDERLLKEKLRSLGYID